MKLKKMIVPAFFSAGLAGVICLLRSEYEKNHLTTTTYVVSSPKLTSEWDGYKIVLLSDLHNKQFGKKNQKLLEEIRAINPDRIISVGDLIRTSHDDLSAKQSPKNLKKKEKKLKELNISLHLLRELCKDYRVTCGNGNHEQRLRDHPDVYGTAHEWYANQLREIGVDYLQDETLVIKGKESDLLIRGLDIDSPHYRKKVKKLPLPDGYIEGKIGKSSSDAFELLLAHSPLFLEEYTKWGADLVCAGHFHGGTIRLPFIGGVMTPQFQFFCKRDKGMHQLGKTKMIVSGGLGTHSINIRFRNLPEVVVICLKSE